MKPTKRTIQKKQLSLELETIRTLELDLVRGGDDDGGGGDLAALGGGIGLTEEHQSCNPACGPA